VGNTDKGTFGVLRHDGVPFALTMELPWRDNRHNESCIPLGVYECRRITSPKFGETFELSNVPDRTHILFHKGNTLADTAGCILIGEEFAGSHAAPSLASSARGFREFMALAEGVERLHLVVSQF